MGGIDFRSLIKRFGNQHIPKEIIIISVSFVVITIVGLVAGNMYMNEMLYEEGVQKSTSLFTEEEMREYGEYCKELEADFQSNIASYIQTYANRENRRGDRDIKYGVYGKTNSEDTVNNDFVDGITIKYAKTKGHNDGDSNFKDILAAVSILADQRQSKKKLTDSNKIKDLIKDIFEMSHTFNGNTCDLYSCTHGCEVIKYYCPDVDYKYSHCDIKYTPFSIRPHSEYGEYSEEDFSLVDPTDECEVCMQKSSVPWNLKKGCVNNKTCYHGDEENHSMGTSEPTPDQCTNWSAYYDCTYEGDGDHDCSDSPIGCGGYYQCNGHPHWECPEGHWYVCCMGHTNLTLNIKIMYLEEIIDTLKNGYDG